MPLTLGSNIASLKAQRELSKSSDSLARVFERLSSGQRINRASDDAAGLALSENLRADSKVFSQGVRNLNDGISLLNLADGALNELGTIVTRIQELAAQSANGTFSAKQRGSIDAEAQELRKEYFRISRSVSFNGLNLFDGSVSEIRLQAGYGIDGGIASTLGGTMGNGTFASVTSYATESNSSWGNVLGDLNGDGFLDLVTAGRTDANDGYVTVRLGTGSGTFGAGTSYNSETAFSNAVALGDLNSDGILDLISGGNADSGGGYATVRLGVGNGTFGASTSYQMESGNTAAVTTADVNNDGVLDLISAGWSVTSGVATIRLGTGSGSFGAATSYLTQAVDSRGVVLTDLNRDGILDLVTSGTESSLEGTIRVRLGTGNGTFATSVSYGMQDYTTYGFDLADLNNDGVLDIVAGGSGASTGTATVRLGTSNGTFGAAVTYISDLGVTNDVSLADVNGDGNIDLLTAGTGTTEGSFSVRLGNGNGGFGTSTSIASENNYSTTLAVGDLNGDGVLDVATAGVSDSLDGFATIFLGQTRSGVAPLLSFSLKTITDAKQTLSYMEQKLGHLSNQRSSIGAFQSRISTSLNVLNSSIENILAADSRIRDADVAFEAAEMLRLQILQNAAAAILGQANQQSSIILKLL